MRNDRNEVPISELLYHFYHKDGVLYWKNPTAPQHRVGQRAGTSKPNPDGYLYVRFKGKGFLVHRIILAMVLGRWPDYVDHKDGNRVNNLPSNLREAAWRHNAFNKNVPERKPDARHLPRGVYLRWDGKKYIARIRRSSGKATTRHLGSFDTPEQASAAYEAAAIEEHGKFAFQYRYKK